MSEDTQKVHKAIHETLTERFLQSVKTKFGRLLWLVNIMQPLARNNTKTCK